MDALWEKTIAPLLREKYPKATEEELIKSKAFAYGGSVAPDMGYYPFGSKLFTNLVHYVRSGDFIQALIDEEKSLNDYAFALGALCHYMSDTYGHPVGINRSVPLVYPKVGKKYGPVVTYAEDKISHMRMEFGFDVLQTARGSYKTNNYHDYIGFAIADTLLETAFTKTYHLDMKEIFPNLKLATNTFRWAVRSLFPEITRTAWVMKKGQIRKSQPGVTSRQFIYHMRRKNYFTEFGRERDKPGFFANVLAVIIRILPKVGPLRPLKFKTPGPEAEKLFVQSFDTVVYHYSELVHKEEPDKVHLINKDFDTGKKTAYGEYPLCDKAYHDLLMQLQKKDFAYLDPALKQNILGFYSKAPVDSTNNKDWKETIEALEMLKKAEVGIVHNPVKGK